MKSTGIVRKIDALGRMVLPSELRANFNLKEGDALEIFTSNDMIVLKKYTPADIFTGEMDNLIEYKGKKVSVNTIKELARIAGLKINDNKNILEDDFEIDAMAAGLDVDELELMDPDERAEALEEAGLDPDDYDFY